MNKNYPLYSVTKFYDFKEMMDIAVREDGDKTALKYKSKGTVKEITYKELEESVQSNIDSGMDYLPFALIVCDANNLKEINDTQGHVAGDEYIKESAKLLCNIFKHSPVFRIGGDEFVVFLRGDDYDRKQELMDKLRNQVLENKESGVGAVLASGIAEYDPENDSLVSEILDRADRAMYENKQKLKA